MAQVAGALVVAAAGNNDEDNDIFPNYPSCYDHEVLDYPAIPTVPVDPNAVILDNIISVGASDESDKKQSSSSYGLATVDLFAPGTNIWSTKLRELPHTATSGAGLPLPRPMWPAPAPCCGISILIKTWTQIKAMIMNGAEDGLPQDFRAICATEGRLNLLNSLLMPDNTPAVFSIFEVPPTLIPGDPTIVPGRADTGDRHSDYRSELRRQRHPQFFGDDLSHRQYIELEYTCAPEPNRRHRAGGLAQGHRQTDGDQRRGPDLPGGLFQQYHPG